MQNSTKFALKSGKLCTYPQSYPQFGISRWTTCFIQNVKQANFDNYRRKWLCTTCLRCKNPFVCNFCNAKNSFFSTTICEIVKPRLALFKAVFWGHNSHLFFCEKPKQIIVCFLFPCHTRRHISDTKRNAFSTPLGFTFAFLLQKMV